jgi:hypothetical protein
VELGDVESPLTTEIGCAFTAALVVLGLDVPFWVLTEICAAGFALVCTAVACERFVDFTCTGDKLAEEGFPLKDVFVPTSGVFGVASVESVFCGCTAMGCCVAGAAAFFTAVAVDGNAEAGTAATCTCGALF